MLDSPDDVASLVSQEADNHLIPRGSDLLRILDTYNNSKEQIRCGLANCHQKHGKGFVVEYRSPDDVVGLGKVGHVCGKKFFGLAAWNVQVSEYRKAQNILVLQNLANEKLRECAVFEPAVHFIKALVKEIDFARTQLDLKAPLTFGACSHAVKSGNGAVSRDDSGFTSGGRIPVRGRAFWTRDPQTPKINRLEADINIIRRKITDPDLPPKTLSDNLGLLGSVQERLKLLLSDAKSDLSALDTDWLKKLIQHRTEKRLRIVGDVLEYEEVRGFWDGKREWVPVLNLGIPLLLFEQATEAMDQASITYNAINSASS